MRRLEPCAAAPPSRALASRGIQLVLAAEQAASRGPGRRPGTTSAVCEARRPCFLSFCAWASPGVPGGTTNGGLPLGAQLRVDGGEPRHGRRRCRRWWPRPSVPVSTQSSLASSYTGPGAHRGDVGAGVRLGGRRTRPPGVSGGAEAPRHPLASCSWVPWAKMPATARMVPKRDIPMPASPQNSSSLTIGREQAGRVGTEAGEGLQAVEPDPGRLLDDGPRSLLALVPFGGRRADHIGGEAVHPVAAGRSARRRAPW